MIVYLYSQRPQLRKAPRPAILVFSTVHFLVQKFCRDSLIVMRCVAAATMEGFSRLATLQLHGPLRDDEDMAKLGGAACPAAGSRPSRSTYERADARA